MSTCIVRKLGAAIQNDELKKFNIISLTIEAGHSRVIRIMPYANIITENGTISGSQNSDNTYYGNVTLTAGDSDAVFEIDNKYELVEFGFWDNISWDKTYAKFDLLEIEYATNIEKLFLISMQIGGGFTNKYIAYLSKLSKLKELYADYSSLIGTVSDLIAISTSITHLSLSGSSISGTMSQLSQLTKLTTLSAPSVIGLTGSIESFVSGQASVRNDSIQITTTDVLTFNSVALGNGVVVNITYNGSGGAVVKNASNVTIGTYNGSYWSY